MFSRLQSSQLLSDIAEVSFFMEENADDISAPLYPPQKPPPSEFRVNADGTETASISVDPFGKFQTMPILAQIVYACMTGQFWDPEDESQNNTQHLLHLIDGNGCSKDRYKFIHPCQVHDDMRNGPVTRSMSRRLVQQRRPVYSLEINGKHVAPYVCPIMLGYLPGSVMNLNHRTLPWWKMDGFDVTLEDERLLQRANFLEHFNMVL